MTPTEKPIFESVVTELQHEYPSSEIMYGSNGMCSAVVYNPSSGVRERKEFNTEGYNLLYCITALSKLLKEKLA